MGAIGQRDMVLGGGIGEQVHTRGYIIGERADRVLRHGADPHPRHRVVGSPLVSTEEARGTMSMVEHGSNQERDMSWLSYSWGPQLSGDGSEVLFTDLSEESGNNYSVYVRKTDGSPAVRLGGGGYASDITLDGKWALVVLPDDPAARLQIVPVGPGQAHVLHWDGIQPRWAEWFPDGHLF